MSVDRIYTQLGMKSKFDNLKNLDNYTLGNQSEALVNDLLAHDGYEFQSSHLPGLNGNNGFDGVLIKKDASGNVLDVLINETKQVSSNGTIQLTSAAGNLPRQMSDDWIEHVLIRMRNQGGNLNDLADIIEMAKDNKRITKVVSGIDKHKNELVLLNLGGG